MRTAVTLLRNRAGKWLLKSGPDVDVVRQKTEFIAGRRDLPDGIVAIMYQPSNGPARFMDLEKQERAEAMARENEKLAAAQTERAEKEKRAHLKKSEAEAKATADTTLRAEAELAARRKSGPLAKGSIIPPTPPTP